jgi:hypothetical protein
MRDIAACDIMPGGPVWYGFFTKKYGFFKKQNTGVGHEFGQILSLEKSRKLAWEVAKKFEAINWGTAMDSLNKLFCVDSDVKKAYKFDNMTDIVKTANLEDAFNEDAIFADEIDPLEQIMLAYREAAYDLRIEPTIKTILQNHFETEYSGIDFDDYWEETTSTDDDDVEWNPDPEEGQMTRFIKSLGANIDEWETPAAVAAYVAAGVTVTILSMFWLRCLCRSRRRARSTGSTSNDDETEFSNTYTPDEDEKRAEVELGQRMESVHQIYYPQSPRPESPPVLENPHRRRLCTQRARNPLARMLTEIRSVSS